MISNLSSIQEKLKTLPNNPGVYFFRDKAHTIIYIGKAKTLKKRVTSYFRGEKDIKTFALVSQVRFLDYMITKNESEALLWENELIKRFSPKYNIDLKDDKTYPYLKLVKDSYPYLLITRKHIKDGSMYYGPYVDVKELRRIVRLLGKIFPLRKCKKNISEGKIKKPCMQYHLGYCMAPCIGAVDQVTYKKIITDMKTFLKGKQTILVRKWQQEIMKLIKGLHFEEAGAIKKKLDVVERMTYFDIKLWHLDESKVREMMKTSPVSDSLEKLLGITKPIRVIAGFDISNISGKHAVGSRVVFIEGKPNKDRYRRYRIKYTKHEPDDVAMMREVFHRCMYGKDTDDINLFLIDGGKGQVNAAYKEMKKTSKKFLIVGLAKKEELIYFPKEKEPLRIDHRSKALQLLMRVRDEAHRFALSYHRFLRKKAIRS